jgi:hypothetical protein
VLLELALALPQPRIPSPAPAPDDVVRIELKRHFVGRVRLGLAARLRALLLAARPLAGLAEELPPTLLTAQPLGQLIAPGLAELFVLGLIGRPNLGQDLARDLIEGVIDLRAGVAGDPRAIDRHHARLDQTRPLTQPEHVTEQVAKRPLMPADKPRDRRVIGHQVRGDHPEGHVLATVTLDRPRGTHPGRKRVEHERDHQRRLIGSPAMTIGPIGRIEPRQVHLGHRLDHKPRQMIGRQPLPHIRRQQEPLPTTTLNEVLAHGRHSINPAGQTPLYATAV